MAAKKPVEKMTYEEAFTELEGIVNALETEQSSLEEAMALYERGQALTHHCGGLLDRAELKITQLSAETSPDTTSEG